MPTPAETIAIMQVSQMLASNDIANGNVFSPAIDPMLPLVLRCERKFLKKIYDNDPSYDEIQQVADYCFGLCQSYGIEAAAIISGGGGTPVSPTVAGQSFPIYITQAAFTTATFYPNTKILGNNIAIFLNEINRYLDPTSEFSVSSTGVTISLGGFDATANNYLLIIEKVYS